MDQLGIVEIGGILLLAGYSAWVMVFFWVVRPRLMNALGRRLSIDVRESIGALDTGLYESTRPASASKSVVLSVADLVILMFGLPGVLALVSIPAFLAADSGVLHRWEGALTHTGVRIGKLTIPDMRAGKSAPAVSVENVGQQAARGCRLATPDYRARDGYLTGASGFFDLAAGEARAIEMSLRVARAVPGVHTFRVSLECSNRLKDRVSATIRVER